MATEKQITANRCNALKSTGPRTEVGKLRSRKNAIRHGLTAETIVSAFENAEDYSDFEEELLAQYSPRSALEHHLVTRLASLFWRLRRATAIEAGLFHIQAQALNESRARSCPEPSTRPLNTVADRSPTNGNNRPSEGDRSELAITFLRIENFNGTIFQKIGYYEDRLWRCAMQTLEIIEASRSKST